MQTIVASGGVALTPDPSLRGQKGLGSRLGKEGSMFSERTYVTNNGH